MELLSQKISIAGLTLEIAVHDLTFPIGFEPGDVPVNHLYVNITGRDASGVRVWTTPLLDDNGKVKAYSTVSDALADAKLRIGPMRNAKAC